MSDFLQNGLIANLPFLNKENYIDLETQLDELNQYRKIALILPSLFSELQGKALKNIIDVLKEVDYIDHIVVTLGRTSSSEFSEAKKFFKQLPQKPILIWNDGANVQRLYKKLNK